MTVALRNIARCVVEPATSVAPTVQLESVVGGSARLADSLPDLPPEGQNQFQPGDVLFSKLRPYLAKSLLVDRPLQGTGEFLCLRPSAELDPRYLKHVTLSQPWLEHAGMSSYGTKMPRTSWEHMATFRLPAMAVIEQRRIADFLDDKVSRIDRIIAARHEQVDLSTKTLEASVYADCEGKPLKPLRRYTLTVQTGGTPSDQADQMDGTPWYSPASFSDDLRLGDPVRRIRADMGVRFPRESVLLVAIGTVGKVAWLDHQATGNQQLTSIHARPKVLNGRFLLHQLNARSDELRRSAPAATLPILNNNLVKAFPVWVPDVRVQQQLADDWDQRLARHRAGRQSLYRSIGLLTEYKTSLITAAVSGELDVTTAGSKLPG